ncbi:hypothetical protein H0H92_001935, partial [Tricholoma furcatifolium]
PSASVTNTGVASSAGNTLPPEATDPVISLNPNEPLYNTTEPIRGPLAATILGPTDTEIVKQNPDLLTPPTTDSGTVLSHNRLQTGGWARQQNINEMPIAINMAGVDMRLEAGAIRYIHSISPIGKGSTQISSVDAEGRNYIATVNAGDLWYFPPGIPHSLQATGDDPDGSEFLLVFDSGTFSEDATFMIALSCSGRGTAPSFQNIPAEELYIFPAALPDPDSDEVVSPQGTVPQPFSFPFSQVKPTQLSGGTVKVVDSTTFNVATAIAAAEVTVEPGAIRELHWHPTQDEWTFFISGQARMTIFAAQSNAGTFDYQAGDIGYVPATMGHYIENTGNTTLHYLEIFNTDTFQDVSLAQWLVLTPPKVVEAHLGLPADVLSNIPKTKQTVIGAA